MVAILRTWGSPDVFPFAMASAVIGESGFLPIYLWTFPLRMCIDRRNEDFRRPLDIR